MIRVEPRLGRPCAWRLLTLALIASLSLVLASAQAAGPTPPPAAPPTNKAGKPGNAAAAKGIEGRVTMVVDGDTLWLHPADGSPRIEVRLYEIDAPEICQEWGEDAKRYLSEQVLNKPARLLPAPGSAARDSAGRTVGTLFVGEANINVRMVEEGHAWSIRTRGGRGPYLKQETMARALRRGLHQVGAAAVMPQDFRRSRGPCPAKPSPAASAPVKK